MFSDLSDLNQALSGKFIIILPFFSSNGHTTVSLLAFAMLFKENKKTTKTTNTKKVAFLKRFIIKFIAAYLIIYQELILELKLEL